MHPLVQLLPLAVVGGCGVWYVSAVRRLVRTISGDEFQSLSEPERMAYMAGEEYRRLRGAVRLPIYATMVAGLVVYLLTRMV
jgi:hypothetical protein